MNKQRLKEIEHHTRHIRLQPSYRKNTWGKTNVTSKLLLCGNWLEKAGFYADDYVSIIVREGILIIQRNDTSE